MPRYVIKIAYDGTDYHGWQVQPDVSSIAGRLQQAFVDVFKQSITLIGASRTDAGVHALGQIALFDTDLFLDPKIIMWAWNNGLPPDIIIRDLFLASANFHPQNNVYQKIYYYHFFLERPLPFVQRYGWYYHYPVDLHKLQLILELFIGTHDFRSFCTGDEMGDDTVRTIDKISIAYIKRFNVYQVSIIGERFMRYMVRRLVGASLEAASRNRCSLADVYTILQAKNPAHSLPTAPAKGLLLRAVRYHDEGNIL